METDKTENLWKSFESGLKSFIYSKVHSYSITEDILQDVFIKIHLKIGTLKDESKLKPWLYQITRNQIIDYYRSTKSPDINPFLSEKDEDETDNSVMSVAVQDMVDMMKDLPEEYCEALCLTELQGMNQKEYAEKIGIPYSSAKSRVQRSRKLLKDMLMRCCHYEFDKYGTVLSISKNCCCCLAEKSEAR